MYMTIDIEVPDWANWIAQDYDGEWAFYEKMPVKLSDRWVRGLYWQSRSRYIIAGYGVEPKDWTQELYQIVR